MEVFGFTNSDASITVWAFQFITITLDFFFKKTLIGLAVIIIGIFLLLVRITYGEPIRKIVFIFFASLAFIYLVLKPTYTPDKIRPFQTDQEITVLDKKPMPLVLLSIDYWLNYMIASLIQLSSIGITEELRYINNPFSLHLNLLIAQQRLLLPIKNIQLAERLRSFIEDEYWPLIVKVNQKDLKLTDSRINSLFSLEGNEAWGRINHEIDDYINADEEWIETITLLKSINSNPTISYTDQIQEAYIKQEVNPSTKMKLLEISRDIYSYWFSLVGSINAYVWLILIPIIMIVFMTMKFALIVSWFKCLIWAKGLWLIGFLIYAVTIVFLRGEKLIFTTRIVDIGAFFLPMLACVSAVFLLRSK